MPASFPARVNQAGKTRSLTVTDDRATGTGWVVPLSSCCGPGQLADGAADGTIVRPHVSSIPSSAAFSGSVIVSRQ
jgi:hypothetical protein